MSFRHECYNNAIKFETLARTSAPVRIINKVITVLILISLIPIVTIVLAFPTVAAGWASEAATSLSSNAASMTPQSRQIMIGIAAGINLVLILLLFFEVRQGKQTKAQIKLIGGGTAEVTFEAVAQRLKIIRERVGGIVSVSPEVSAKRKKIDVKLEVAIMPETNVPNKIEQLQSIVKEIVEQQMGLQLARAADVVVRHASGLEKMSKANPFTSTGRQSNAGASQTPIPPPPPPANNAGTASDTGITEIRG